MINLLLNKPSTTMLFLNTLIYGSVVKPADKNLQICCFQIHLRDYSYLSVGKYGNAILQNNVVVFL